MRGASDRLPVECVMSDREAIPILNLNMFRDVIGPDCNTWGWLP